MKKLLVTLFLIVCIFACTEQETGNSISPTPIVTGLGTVGIRLESNFISNQANYSVKLDEAQPLTVKIIDISGKTISTETVNAKAGDNTFTLYTKALPKTSYQLKLYNSSNQELGQTIINVL